MLEFPSELEPERRVYRHATAVSVQPEDEQIFTEKRSQAGAW